MTTTTSATPRRKTEQAIKISATWTPGTVEAHGVSMAMWGQKTPLRIRGGRLTINASVLLDLSVSGSAARVEARIAELRKELEATGTVHNFVTQAGAVPAGTAERLPVTKTPGGSDDLVDPEEEALNDEARAQGAAS